MSHILAAASSLNKMLLDSDEYKEYLNALENLGKFPEYKEMADNFRKKQVQHEIQKINGETPSYDELALANDYADICLITVCNDFFQAEIKLLALIKEVYRLVCDGLNVDMY